MIKGIVIVEVEINLQEIIIEETKINIHLPEKKKGIKIEKEIHIKKEIGIEIETELKIEIKKKNEKKIIEEIEVKKFIFY